MESRVRGKLFSRWLCQNYRTGNAVGNFFCRRISPTAWFMVGLLGVSILLGANIGQSVVIILTALLCGLLVVALIWAFLRRAKISITREIPPTGAVGAEIQYTVHTTNDGMFKVRDVFLHEASDDPRPTEWEFLNLVEPGEEKRNIFDRTFLFYRWKWLLERGGRWSTRGRSHALEIQPRETVQTRLTLVPHRRGILLLEDMRAELPDPLGLFQRSRYVGQERDEILVIPKRYKLPDLNLDGKSELKLGGEAASNIRGDGGEFLGLREYHQGDSLRRIDWKAWGKTGDPIVREYEEARFPRYGLILDTNLRDSGPELFEEAVSVAASFVSSIDRNRCLLDLMFAQDAPEVFTAGRGKAKDSGLLEVLALVEGNDQGDYENLRRLVFRHAPEITACIVVLTGWNEERKSFVAQLRQSGLEVALYVIGVGEQPEDATGVKWLRWDQVQQDLMKG